MQSLAEDKGLKCILNLESRFQRQNRKDRANHLPYNVPFKDLTLRSDNMSKRVKTMIGKPTETAYLSKGKLRLQTDSWGTCVGSN